LPVNAQKSLRTTDLLYATRLQVGNLQLCYENLGLSLMQYTTVYEYGIRLRQ